MEGTITLQPTIDEVITFLTKEEEGRIRLGTSEFEVKKEGLWTSLIPLGQCPSLFSVYDLPALAKYVCCRGANENCGLEFRGYYHDKGLPQIRCSRGFFSRFLSGCYQEPPLRIGWKWTYLKDIPPSVKERLAKIEEQK